MKYALLLLAACAGPDVAPPTTPISQVPQDAPLVSQLIFDAPPGEEAPPMDAAPPELAQAPEVWLKGSTHVHAKPSGDSSEPIDDVIKWYEAHGYDFIALTDHNKVSEVSGDTRGRVAVRSPGAGLIVLSGIELTHNPSGCLPVGDKSNKCRIHVNVLGVTARPHGKIEWAQRHSHQRIDMYQAALDAARALGGSIVQINHPQWFWGMTADLLAELARRHALLVEIHNAQFLKWSNGDKDHPSMDTLWDSVLERGLTMWGVASDDAHDYRGKHGKYPAGGAWVVVKSRRDPQAILDALAAGHFYASDGVVLDRAEVVAGELVVEVAANEQGTYAIEFIENGKVIETIKGRSARHPIPQTGYVRAVVTRDDDKHAWIEPARL